VALSSGGVEVASAVVTIRDTSTEDSVAPVVDAGQAYTYDENQEADAVIATVTAEDNEGGTGVESYAIVSGDEDGYFDINADGEITLTEDGLAAAANDFETGDNEFTLGVTATDGNENTSDATDVVLSVGDVDDVAPALSTATFGANEATLTYDEALDTASVPNPSDFLVTVQGESTTIGVNSVSVSGNQVVLDMGREPAAGETFLVDYTPGVNPLQDTVGNPAEALDDQALIADEAAPVIDAGQAFTYMEESLAAGEVIGTVAASDDVGISSFSIDAGDTEGFFAINLDGEISLTAAGAAANVASNDFETTPNQYTLTVTAVDAAANTTSEDVTITITNDPEDDGEQFTLTPNIDAGADFTGGPGDDVFFGTEDTLTSGDNLDGAGGDADRLNYSSSGNDAVNEAGFTLEDIEFVQVTADAVNGTTFDLTNTTGVQTLTNSNSSEDLTFTGAQELFDLQLVNVGDDDRPSTGPNTAIQYQKSVVAGTADEQNILFNNNVNADLTEIGTVTVNGIEIFNLTTEGQASWITELASDKMETVDVFGDQDLTIKTALVGATTIDANTFEGDLSVVADI